MKVKTALRHQDKFIGIVREIHSMGRNAGLSFDGMLAEFDRRLFKDLTWKRVPGCVRSFVEGYRFAQREEDNQHHIAWKVHLDGRYIDSKDVPSGRWKDVDPGFGCHFWKRTGKPFGNPKPEEKPAGAA